jgi:protein TonB
VQIPAQFPGGQAAWVKYLERNLRSEIPIDNGAPSGNYTVIISFIVDRQGNISDVQLASDAKDPGYGILNEAIRVIQRGPKWIPAQQQNNKVICRHSQPITFQVAEN